MGGKSCRVSRWFTANMAWQEAAVRHRTPASAVGVCFTKKIQVTALSTMVWWDDIGRDRADRITTINGTRMVTAPKKTKTE